VDVLVRSESVAILQDRVTGLSEVDAGRLAAQLGDLPLAIAQAAGFMAETGAGSWARTTPILCAPRVTWPPTCAAWARRTMISERWNRSSRWCAGCGGHIATGRHSRPHEQRHRPGHRTVQHRASHHRLGGLGHGPGHGAGRRAHPAAPVRDSAGTGRSRAGRV